MKFKTFINRVFNDSIKFRGRYSLIYTYKNGIAYRLSIEHLTREDHDLLIYSETITYCKNIELEIEIKEKKEVLHALFEELTKLEYKFIIDQSVPPKF